MKVLRRTWKYAGFLLAVVLLMTTMTVFATGASGDNSLASLGIENAEVSPDFYYSTVEYSVTVPAGTTELTLNPQPSDGGAEVVSINGATLQDGQGTVTITVQAPNGSQAVYTLHVTADQAAAAPIETEMIAETQAPTPSTDAPQTEVKTNETVQKLNKQVDDLKDRINLGMKVLYGLIGFSVLLLFLIINLLLKNKDLKDDLREAENSLDFTSNEFARKEKNMSTDYYYAPVQEMQSDSVHAPGVSVDKIQAVTKETFGNAEAQAAVEALQPESVVRSPKADSIEAALQEESNPIEQQAAQLETQIKQETALKDDEQVDIDMIEL